MDLKLNNAPRHTIIHQLWDIYLATNPAMQTVVNHLHQCGIHTIPLDHLAIIDLPGPHTGIHRLTPLFTSLGFNQRGADYLPDKQNDFVWLAEAACEDRPATQVLPQVVVADFRLHELPDPVRRIITKYADAATPPSDLTNEAAIVHYLSGRDWPLPTIDEFRAVQAWNKLLAWVLIFGRRPNHFTIAVHHLPGFKDIYAFQRMLEDELQLTLNHQGGVIKGSAQTGIQQGSTIDQWQSVSLSDGTIELSAGFVEFIWRHPLTPSHHPLTRWRDYFTGFVAKNANHVIESLYLHKKKDNLCKVHG